MRTIDTEVLVIGAGPAGLTAAALLARHKVQAITITKYNGTANSPRRASDKRGLHETSGRPLDGSMTARMDPFDFGMRQSGP